MAVKNYSSYLFIVLAGALFGIITVGGQILGNLGFSVYEAALYGQIAVALFLLPFIFTKKRYSAILNNLSFFIVFGFIEAILQIFQIGGALLGAPIAVVAFLLFTQPIYTTILSRILFKEHITLQKIIAIILGIAGAFVLVKPLSFGYGNSTLGVLFGFLGGISLSLWIIYGKMSSLRNSPPVATTFGQGAFASLWLVAFLPVFVFMDNSALFKFSLYPATSILTIFLISAPITLGIFLFYLGLKKVDASNASLLLLLEPISAALLGLLLFNQDLGYNIFLGGVLILVSNYLVIRGAK